MRYTLAVLAQAADPTIRDFVKVSVVPFLLVALLIAVGVWMLVRVRARFRDNEDPTAADHQMLMQISNLRRQGDLSEEEYRSIKGRLVERLGDPAPPPNEPGRS